MLPNFIRLFEAPLQHLNSIQNLEKNAVTVGCKAFFFTLFFLSISSLEQAHLLNVLCYLICHVGDLFLKFLHLYWLHPSTFFHLSSGTALCVFFSLSLLMLDISYMWKVSVLSLCLNFRQDNNLENIEKNMISMYLLIRIPNGMTRQHGQNINLNKHVFPSWQINGTEQEINCTSWVNFC